MGFMDKLKGWFGGNKQQVDQGIDKAADAVKDKVPDQHDEKVDQVAEKAKDVVDNLAGDSGGATPSGPAPAVASEPVPRATTSEPGPATGEPA
jgi:hypothetical protein